MPLLRERYHLELAQVPFDFPELIAALAPRAFFTCSPLRDANFDVEGVRVCMTAAQPGLRAARSRRSNGRRLSRCGPFVSQAGKGEGVRVLRSISDKNAMSPRSVLLFLVGGRRCGDFVDAPTPLCGRVQKQVTPQGVAGVDARRATTSKVLSFGHPFIQEPRRCHILPGLFSATLSLRLRLCDARGDISSGSPGLLPREQFRESPSNLELCPGLLWQGNSHSPVCLAHFAHHMVARHFFSTFSCRAPSATPTARRLRRCSQPTLRRSPARPLGISQRIDLASQHSVIVWNPFSMVHASGTDARATGRPVTCGKLVSSRISVWPSWVARSTAPAPAAIPSPVGDRAERAAAGRGRPSPPPAHSALGLRRWPCGRSRRSCSGARCVPRWCAAASGSRLRAGST